MKTLVLTDSAGAMTSAEAKSLGIGWLPLQIYIDSRSYLDGVDLDTKTLYEKLEAGLLPSTSQPPLVLIQSVLTSAKRAGVTDIVAVHLAHHMSSTARVIASTARTIGLQVHTFDLCSAQAVEYYLAYGASQMAAQGVDPETICQRLFGASRQSSSWLVVSDLKYLALGGRLRPIRMRLSALLGIRPILEISPETGGLVELKDRARTFSKALDVAIDHVQAQLDPSRDYEFFISTSEKLENAVAAIVRLRERLGEDISVHILEMGSLVSCHIGLGLLAIQYIEKLPGVRLPSKIALHSFSIHE